MSMNRIKLETGAVRVPFTTGMTGEEADGRAVKKASDRIRRITGAVPENLRVARKSIDARRGEISFVYTVYGEIEADGKRVSKILRSAEESGEIRIHSDPVLEPKRGDRPLNFRPVIVGFGPAGMFAGLLLASEGYSPLILERGGSVEERTAAVERFISGELKFTEIADCVEYALTNIDKMNIGSMDELLYCDAQARRLAREYRSKRL